LEDNKKAALWLGQSVNKLTPPKPECKPEEISMSQYDVQGWFQFLSQTPEQGLRKMLVDNKPMTDAHFSLLLKVVRAGDEAKFVENFEKKDYPKVKLSPGEQKIRDKFWDDCVTACTARGILQPGVATKVA
jgi:hypothetical protein